MPRADARVGQSTADLRRRETGEALLWPLRELAANLLRMAKRGGRPVYLVRQMSDCLAALKEYAEWELLRLRGMKVSMLHATLPRAMSSLIADAQDLVKVETE